MIIWQPRGGKSITTLKLEELARKKKELEGEIPTDLVTFRSTKVRRDFASYEYHIRL